MSCKNWEKNNCFAIKYSLDSYVPCVVVKAWEFPMSGMTEGVTDLLLIRVVVLPESKRHKQNKSTLDPFNSLMSMDPSGK